MFAASWIVSTLQAALVGVLLLVTPASAAGIEPEADSILRAMTNYVARLNSFTAEFDAEDETINSDGLKLQYDATGRFAAQRPGKLYFSRKGQFADIELTFDGTLISVLAKRANVYAQITSRGPTIDEAVDEWRASTGLDASSANLFAADSYWQLTHNVTQGIHVGASIVGGTECEHLAFRTPQSDWQIWIQKGEQPLPLKYVVTDKWVTGAPQHVVRLRNWNVAPEISAKLFEFKAPQGAHKVETLSPDLVGEVLGEILP